MGVGCLRRKLRAYKDGCPPHSPPPLKVRERGVCRGRCPVVHEVDFGITVEEESALVVDSTHVAEGLRTVYDAAPAVSAVEPAKQASAVSTLDVC